MPITDLVCAIALGSIAVVSMLRWHHWKLVAQGNATEAKAWRDQELQRQLDGIADDIHKDHVGPTMLDITPYPGTARQLTPCWKCVREGRFTNLH